MVSKWYWEFISLHARMVARRFYCILYFVDCIGLDLLLKRLPQRIVFVCAVWPTHETAEVFIRVLRGSYRSCVFEQSSRGVIVTAVSLFVPPDSDHRPGPHSGIYLGDIIGRNTVSHWRFHFSRCAGRTVWFQIVNCGAKTVPGPILARIKLMRSLKHRVVLINRKMVHRKFF